MNHDDMPMWDDPAESSRLRQLLRAGRDAASSYQGYNVERGVVRHLSNLQAGVPLPDWAAAGLPSAKTAMAPFLAWLAVPILAATALVGVWATQRDADPPQPVVTGQPASALTAETTANVAVEATASANGHALPQPTAAMLEAPRPRDRRAERLDPRGASNATNAVTNAVTKAIARATPVRGDRALATRAQTSNSVNAVRAAPLSASGQTAGAAIGQQARNVTAPASAAEAAAKSEPEEAQANLAPAAPEVPRTPEPSPVSADSRLEREMQMLAVAQRILADNPSRALSLARQGEHEFSGSMFSAERKQVALLALVRLGRLDEARRLGRPFLVAYPNAPWSERLRRALATGQLPTR